MPPASFMARLRTRTRDAHDRLEATPRLSRIFARDYQLAEYAALLQAMRGFHAPLEAQIAGALTPALHHELAGRGHLAALDHDLAALECPMPITLPQCGSLPEIKDADAALGAQYVLEGSTLGAQVIVRHLHEHFGSAVVHATRYHAGYGASNGAMWRHFKALVEQHVAETRGASERVLTAADETFAALAGWLAEPLAASPCQERG